MTHWHFSDGTGVEILTFLDDYSRRVLACEVFSTVKGNDVRRVFAEPVPFTARRRQCSRTTGPSTTREVATVAPASRATSDRRVLYKHSTPYHPQTCGKVERWHRTLKRFLAKHPAANIVELQAVLDEVVRYYNDVRPHRGAIAKHRARLRGTRQNASRTR